MNGRMRNALQTWIRLSVSMDANVCAPHSILTSSIPYNGKDRLIRGAKTSAKRVLVELVQQVDGLGRPGEVKNVPPGYARNYLLPNRLAKLRIDQSREKRLRGLSLAASAIMDAVPLERGQAEETGHVELRHEEDQQEALRIKKETKKLETIVRKLTETVITYKSKVRDGGVLESSIGPKDLTVAVAKQLGIEIVEELVDMEGDVIDTAGDFLIPLKLIKGDGTKTHLQLRVVAS